MLVLGIQGSPRKKSNSADALDRFLETARGLGARTQLVNMATADIQPCRELVVCERTGFCPIKDEMDPVVFPALRAAEVVVVTAPVFFYNVPAQLKGLIDRCQTLWARKHRLKLRDPLHRQRRGFWISVGATHGRQLFDGIDLTFQYFFEALDAAPAGHLAYRGVEHRGDLKRHDTAEAEITAAAERVVAPLASRPRVLFVDNTDSQTASIAAALAGDRWGDRLDAMGAGMKSAGPLAPETIKAVAHRGLDMAFHQTGSLESALADHRPDQVVMIGTKETDALPPNTPITVWDDPNKENPEAVLDLIDDRLTQWLNDWPPGAPLPGSTP